MEIETNNGTADQRPSDVDAGAADQADVPAVAVADRPAPAAVSRPAGRGWALAAAIVLPVVVLLTFAVLFALPVHDGDLWWQMAYGRQMLANRTLVPDHTAFTWTPTEGETIYCAWLSEILLYLAYQLGRLPLLFALRYACMAVLPFVIWRAARRGGVAGRPLTWLVCMIAMLMSAEAAYLKPEISSFALMTTMTAVWIRLKAGEAEDWRWCWLLPLLTLIWVNSHGGYIFGVLFLLVMLLGEEMNALFSPAAALPLRVRRHLYLAGAVSFVALLATPYGLSYPLQLAEIMANQEQTHLDSVAAYASIFAKNKRHLHLAEYFVAATVVLGALAAIRVRARKIDWALLLTNVVFAWLYTRFLRTTFYWAPIFALTSVRLLARTPRPERPVGRVAVRVLAGLAALLTIGLGARAFCERSAPKIHVLWLGFGVSYFSPIEEALFIEENLPYAEIGNDYTSGGYLLWALSPERKIFIDPRYFPFREWYSDYRDLIMARAPEKTLKRHPCNVWVVQHRYRAAVSWFAKSRDWKPVFYGPVAVVFVKADRKEARQGARPIRGEGVRNLRNVYHAALVSVSAIALGDFEGAQIALAGAQGAFWLPSQRKVLSEAKRLCDGLRAYVLGDYRTAATHLEVLHGGVLKADGQLIRCYHHLASEHWKRREDQAALEAASRAVALAPDDSVSLFNLGAIQWCIETESKDPRGDEAAGQTSGPDPDNDARRAAPSPDARGERDWQANLARFVEKAGSIPAMPAEIVTVARSILAGDFHRRPPILVVTEPGAARRARRPQGAEDKPGPIR